MLGRDGLYASSPRTLATCSWVNVARSSPSPSGQSSSARRRRSRSSISRPRIRVSFRLRASFVAVGSSTLRASLLDELVLHGDTGEGDGRGRHVAPGLGSGHALLHAGHSSSAAASCVASTGCAASVETITSAPDSDHAPVATKSRVTASGLAPLRRNSVTCSGVTDTDRPLSIVCSCVETAFGASNYPTHGRSNRARGVSG